jgi:hypothetical protein
MGSTRPSTRNTDHDQPNEQLLEENKQLRELVIQLSKIIIKNVVDQK